MKEDAVQLEELLGGLSNGEVAPVDRIKAAAKKSQSHA